MSVTMPTSLDIQWATNEEPVTFPQFQKTNSADATRTDKRQVLHGAAQQALTTSSPNRKQPREEADSSDDEGTGFVFPDTTPKRIRVNEPLDIRTHDELNYLHTDADMRLPPEFDSENDDDDDDNPMLADTGDDEVEEHEEQKKVNGPLVFAAVNKRDKNRNTNDAVEESEEDEELRQSIANVNLRGGEVLVVVTPPELQAQCIAASEDKGSYLVIHPSTPPTPPSRYLVRIFGARAADWKVI